MPSRVESLEKPSSTSGPGFESPFSATSALSTPPLNVISSAHALQTSIVAVIPQIQSYIHDPINKVEGATKAIKNVLPIAKAFSDTIGGDQLKPCSVSTNPLTSIFNIASCASQTLQKAVDNIGGGKTKIDDLKADLSILKDLQKPLTEQTKQQDNNEDKEDGEDEGEDQKSMSSKEAQLVSDKSIFEHLDEQLIKWLLHHASRDYSSARFTTGHVHHD
ncbi:MAG: hypothetical protein Q9164_001746 [Protoblastenia rupestris]